MPLPTMSPTPLAFLNYGDINIVEGTDVTQYGYGDINIQRHCNVYGTTESTTPNNGTLVVNGGVGIGGSANIQVDLNVLYGITRLTETHIDTNNGLFSVTGGNMIDFQVGAASQFITTGGNLSLKSTNNTVELYGGNNSLTAVDIKATNSNGGIQLLSGIGTGKISLITGSGGLEGTTSNGNISITANNGEGSFNVYTNTANQNLTVGLYNKTDSTLRIESEGTNVTNTALVINTTNTNGNIVISTANGLGQGSLSQLVGSGGYNVTTNTNGPITITSNAATSSYIVKSNSNNENLILDLQNPTDSSIILQSEGTNKAVDIKTTNTAGSIHITEPVDSTGSINLLSGTGGMNLTTRTGGQTTITTNGAASTYTNATTSDNQHLTVSVTGNTNSKVIISSTGTSNEAIKLETTNGTGGISMSSVGRVQIESADPNTGVNIATTTSGIPVKIGTTNSTTTIMGDLNVKGVTTTINSVVTTVDDNIIVVNNAPTGTSDGGLAIKRYQHANDSGQGDVVNDIPDDSGTVLNGDNTSTTIHLDQSGKTANYYSGWWIKIYDGEGSGQVRRIKSFDENTQIATIYSTIEQTTLLNNPSPVEGMDFITIPNTTSKYHLYPCHYVMTIWDESNDEFAFICSNQSPSEVVNPSHYSNLHLNNLIANGIQVNTINNSAADITTTVILDNGPGHVPITISDFPLTYGVYMLFVKPNTDSLRAHAIFVVGRVNVPSIPGTSTRLISVKGATSEQLDIQWSADAKPQLMYRPRPSGLGGSTTYKIKIVSL
jgi:hypothetical protein